VRADEDSPVAGESLTERGKVAKLLEHPEVVSHRKVLHDLCVCQAKAMDVLYLERFSGWREIWSLKGRSGLGDDLRP